MENILNNPEIKSFLSQFDHDQHLDIIERLCEFSVIEKIENRIVNNSQVN